MTDEERLHKIHQLIVDGLLEYQSDSDILDQIAEILWSHDQEHDEGGEG